MVLSASQGLPYLHFWDEPILIQGALDGIKNNQFTPVGVETVYGGFMRYVSMLTDLVYFTYLKISGEVQSFSDVKTGADGAHMSISHPGFYYWNRIASVLIALAGYVFLYLIGRLKFGKIVGVIAGIMLMSIYIYFSTAYQVKTNVPLGTWFLATLYFSLKFNDSGKSKYLKWSLISVGLAFATKYTGALFIIIPAIAFLFNRIETSKPLGGLVKRVVTLGLIPLGVFILFNPLIYIWPKPIVDRIKWVSEVYKTGAGHPTKTPGWEQLSYQSGYIFDNIENFIGVFFLTGIIIGIYSLARRGLKDKRNQNFLITAIFPLLYLLFLSRYAISYHQNYLLLYPFIVILASEGIFSLSEKLKSLTRRKQPFLLIIPFLVTVVFLHSNYVNILNHALYQRDSKDTRVKMIEWFYENEVPDQVVLGIAEGLPIRPRDLEKISTEYQYFDISNLRSEINNYSYVIIPDFTGIHSFDNIEKDQQDSFILDNKLYKFEGLPLDYNLHRDPIAPVINPSITILKGSYRIPQ